jgi:tol-pal system-associated acyl-CoA thioesterase
MQFTQGEGSDFYLPIRVYLEDTDAGGVVFYANYLKFFERARTEFVRTSGFEMRRSLADQVSFVVSSLTIDYRGSCYLDEMLRVYVAVESVKKSYFVVRQWIAKEAEPSKVAVEGTVKVACVGLQTGKPMAMPSELHDALN